jgi:sulfite reductase beta subunit-like hemoprotein
VEAGVFAGELTSETLRSLAVIAGRFAAGYMVLTSTQNVSFLLPDGVDPATVRAALAEIGFSGDRRDQRTIFRICPGSHECKMGLSPTRDIAREMLDAMGTAGEKLSWAISGCFNSCSQPQLAEVGIVTSKSVPAADGTRQPQFDLYRRTTDDSFGERVRERISVDELLEAVRQLDVTS